MPPELRVETSGSPGARRVDVTCGRVRLHVDTATGRARVATHAGDIVEIGAETLPALPANATSGRPVLVIGEVKRLAGPVLRVELQHAGADRVGTRLAVEVDRAGHGVAAFVSVENRSPDPLPHERSIVARRSGARPASSFLLAPGPDATPLGWIESGGGECSLVAFTGASTATVHTSAGTLAILPASPQLAPGERAPGERVWIGIGEVPGALAAEWARRVGVEAHARVPRRPPVIVRGVAPGSATAQAIGAWSPGAAVECPVAPDEPGLVAAAAHARCVHDAGLRAAFRVALDATRNPTTLTLGLARLGELAPIALTLDGVDRAVPRRHDRIDVVAWRSWLSDVRAALGPDPLLIAPDAPLLASLGLVDGLDLGASVWLRLALTQRVALDDHGSLANEATDSMLRMRAIAGGVLRLHPPDDAHARAALAKHLPPLGRLATPLGEPARDECITARIPLVGERFALLVHSNVARATPLADKGSFDDLPAGATVFDVDAECPRSLESLRDEHVAPHASRLFVVTPAGERAQIVGSTLHDGAGTTEALSVRDSIDGRITLRLRLPGPRSGRLWVATRASAGLRQRDVSFIDEAALEV